MPQVTLDQALPTAMQLHREGQLDQAEQIYRQILVHRPNDADALQLLGVLLEQQGKDGEAALRQSIAIRPSAEALSNLANVLHLRHRYGEAIEMCQRAIAISPLMPEAHHNLAVALRSSGQAPDALAPARQAIALRNLYPEAHANLGCALRDLGHLAEAEVALRQALQQRPAFADAMTVLAEILQRLGRRDEAVSLLREAILIDPRKGSVHQQLGLLLAELKQEREAIASLSRAVELDPTLHLSHRNLGRLLHQHGRLDEALASYRSAVALMPADADTHHNLALALLAAGQFREGWAEYEWRFQSSEYGAVHGPEPEPRWDGQSELAGRVVRVHHEQGLGDTIQFLRYLPSLKARGATIVIDCPRELARLIEAHYPGVTTPRVPDLHVAMMSLPHLLGLPDPATSAAWVPYLRADPATGPLANTMAGASHPRVGLVWAGGTINPNDARRSVPFDLFARCLAGPGRLFSLQLGPARASADRMFGGGLVDLSPWLVDLLDTARAIAGLDLVISVDTAVAHLAGAMGKPTWLLLPHLADFRWGTTGETTPWYPTMRLFRQQTAGDWIPVLDAVAEALARS